MVARLFSYIAREPARFATRAVALAAAVFAVLTAFGVQVTPAQTAAVSGLLAVLTAAVGEVIRELVMPMPKVGELVQAQAERTPVIPPLPPPPRTPRPPDEAA